MFVRLIIKIDLYASGLDLSFAAGRRRHGFVSGLIKAVDIKVERLFEKCNLVAALI